MMSLQTRPFLADREGFTFIEGAIDQEDSVGRLFEDFHFTHIINLATPAGIPFSLEQPRTYLQSNVVGLLNVL